METPIYTSIIGGVDQLSAAPDLENVSFHCYSDIGIKSKNYTVFPQKVGENKWLQSRKFKILSHNYYQKKSLWIDGRVEVKASVLDFISEHSQKDFTVFKHPYSSSIQEEAQRCLDVGILEDGQLIHKQLKKYREEGFKDHWLMAGGIILRKNSKVCQAINNLWWKELNEFPTRDEISLPFVLWKLGLKVNVLDLDIFNNPYFKFNARRQGDLIL